jgi:SAM-dependent methyltransferase
MQLSPFIVCPETLGPLELRDGGFWSPCAERLYRVGRGLVFMAYPERDAAMIAATMAEERQHQGLGEEVAMANLAYLRSARRYAVDFINLLERFVARGEPPPRSLELGCGNGWFSWLLAEAGFEVWMCDFEANSLATGLNLEHPNIGEGRRFVADARYAPMASGSMDLVVFKEFVHHVADHQALFREANRVLCTGGTVALMEPVRSVLKTLRELRRPDPHEGHHITWPGSYLRAIRGAGFEVAHYGPVYLGAGNTRPLTAWMKRRAEAAIDERHPAGDWVSKLQLRLFGGAQLVVVAHKVRDLPPAERPPMRVIDPATLVIEEAELAGYEEFPIVLSEAATRLNRLASA